ncbi:MAG TPA: hypothetical protein VL944_02145 [Candidatus Acidoferrum sp.]|nr:hypothetical protein [Candidatus Acidoferrum sp.]
MAFSLGNLFKKGSGKPKISITAVNIKWRGAMHGMEGFEVKEKQFTVTIPFQNKTQKDALPFEAIKERFRSQEKAPILLTKIEVSDPFKLVSTDPKLPYSVASSEKVELKVTADAPDYTYTGPMSITLTSEEGSMIKVQINKVIVHTQMRSVEIENSGIIINIPKGAIFKNSIQMYKAMSYGERVDKVTLQKPFEFVNTEPALPFTINQPSSYLVTFYIKAPELDYAGPMEIYLE